MFDLMVTTVTAGYHKLSGKKHQTLADVDHFARPVQAGAFGETMEVTIINDGPVTMTLDSQVIQIPRKKAARAAAAAAKKAKAEAQKASTSELALEGKEASNRSENAL